MSHLAAKWSGSVLQANLSEVPLNYPVPQGQDWDIIFRQTTATYTSFQTDNL
jgi:hypothetical protein